MANFHVLARWIHNWKLLEMDEIDRNVESNFLLMFLVVCTDFPNLGQRLFDLVVDVCHDGTPLM